jgi:hypothetical protein
VPGMMLQSAYTAARSSFCMLFLSPAEYERLTQIEEDFELYAEEPEIE